MKCVHGIDAWAQDCCKAQYKDAEELAIIEHSRNKIK